jgi:hypothetical protein
MRVFETVPGPGIVSSYRRTGRVDASVAQEHAIERHLDVAKKIKAQRERVVRAIGEAGYKFLERILRDGMPYTQLAETTIGEAKCGGGPSRSNSGITRDLVEAWSAKGPAGKSFPTG